MLGCIARTRTQTRLFAAASCPYRILGLETSASSETVKQRFRELAKQYHPDVNNAPDASTRMAEISAAYEKLTDGTYSPEFSAGTGNSQSTDSSFSAFAEAFERMRRQSASRASSTSSRGADVSATLEISFPELFRLETKTLRVARVRQSCETCTGSGCRPGTRPSRCAKCKGTGMVRLDRGIMSIGIPCDVCAGKGERIAAPCGDCKGEGVREKDRTVHVKIPAGTRNFAEIRVPALGHAGAGQFARNGDLYVTIKIKEDGIFKIVDDDIYLDAHVTLGQFLLGGAVTVPTPEGQTLSVKLEPGIPIGSTKTLKGRGMVKVKNMARGDLIVKLNLATNFAKLTKRQIELLKEFDEIENNNS